MRKVSPRKRGKKEQEQSDESDGNKSREGSPNSDEGSETENTEPEVKKRKTDRKSVSFSKGKKDARNEDEDSFTGKAKNGNKTATPKSESKKNKEKPRSRLSKKKDKDSSWDENEEFEVDRIIEVHHKKDGHREFLVSWKGYPPSQNSWEPEENMDCGDLIAKFMAKVEQAKKSERRELRLNRQHTDRFTLSTPDSGRRLSRRQKGLQRVHYHDAE